MARLTDSPRAAERLGIAMALVCAVLVFGLGVHPVIVLPVSFGGITVFMHLHSRTRPYRER